jgi:hypothetical protein
MPPLARLDRGCEVELGELAPWPAGETFISHRALGLMSCLAGRDGVTSPEASITDSFAPRRRLRPDYVQLGTTYTTMYISGPARVRVRPRAAPSLRQ